MDEQKNAKKDSVRRTQAIDLRELDPNLLRCSGPREEGDKDESERCIGATGQKELDRASEVIPDEGAVQLIGGICRRLDKQDERLLQYACQHNNRLQERKQQSDNFIAEFKEEQGKIREETQELLNYLKAYVKE
ncbi:hypothetical protein CYANOKiyG1_73240 [Okeania sp. KiyG1]|nr:hypothetical protein [Okeania sp. KiyG1]GGA53197.1 hypothetical protein CYANOKiyG1_73240 [Okeania sp. KiyG1]